MALSLPYNLPNNMRSQINFLAKVTNTPSNLLINAGETELEALGSVILYRHMSQAQRNKAMQTIRSVNNRALEGELVTKAIDTTFLNPKWGVWSLSNAELLENIEFHDAIDTAAGAVGVTASVLSGKDLVKHVIAKRSIGRKNWIVLVIWGCAFFNKNQLNNLNRELSNRQTLNQSGLYQ